MFTGKQLCWSLFLIKLEEPCNFIKRNSNISVFLWNFRNFWKHFFYRTHPVGTFGNISWTLSLLHMRTMNGVISRYVLALQRSFSFIACVSFLSISFFSSYYLFVNSTTCWGTDVNLSILRKRSEVIPMFLSEISRGELLQPYLVINVTGLVQFGKNLSYILPSLAS